MLHALYQCRLHSLAPIPITIPALQSLALPPLLLPEAVAGSITNTLANVCCYTHHERSARVAAVLERARARTHTLTHARAQLG